VILTATWVAGVALIEAVHGPEVHEDESATETAFWFMAFDLAMAWVIFA
jgi:hypothetical protein